MVGIVDKGVHEPEFEGLDILSFEVGVVQFAHDAAPTAAGLGEATVLVDAGAILRGGHVVVVGASLLWVVSEVEFVNDGEVARGYVFVREDLLFGDAAGVWLGAVVVGDVARRV